jgi:uncharacterized protein (TIGR00730 family)
MAGAATHRTATVQKEFSKTFAFLKNYPLSVTIFGSARFSETNPYYIKARRLTQRIARELKYTVITGGGGGIMEAGNRGAYEVGGKSVGMNIQLPHEQKYNTYLTAFMKFHYFFSRRVALSFSAECYIFFPGGYGTLDEFFEVVTLIQTGKIPKTPVVLVGKDFWGKIDSFIKEELLKRFDVIDPQDVLIYTMTDDEDQILDIIKKAPLRRE